MEGNEAAAWARSKYRLTQQRKRGRGGRGGRGSGRAGPGPSAALDHLDSNYDRYAEEEAEDVAAEDGAAPRLSEGADLEKLLADSEALHAQAWYRHRSQLSALGDEGAEALPAVDVKATEAALALDLDALAASLAALPAAELLGVPDEYLEGLQLEGLEHWRGWQQQQQQPQDAQQLQMDQQQPQEQQKPPAQSTSMSQPKKDQQWPQEQHRPHAHSLPTSQQPVTAPQQQQRSSAALLPWERLSSAARARAPAPASAPQLAAAASGTAVTNTAQQPAASTPPMARVPSRATPQNTEQQASVSSAAASQPASQTLNTTAAAPAASMAAARVEAEDDFLDTLLTQARASSSTKQAVAAVLPRPTLAPSTQLPPAQQRSSRPTAAVRRVDDSLDALIGSSSTSSATGRSQKPQPVAPKLAPAAKLPDPGGSNSQAKGAPKPSLDDWLDSL